MKAKNILRVTLTFFLVCVFVTTLSVVLRKDAGTLKKPALSIKLTGGTTSRDIATTYGFEPRLLKKAFNLQEKSDFDKPLSALGIPSTKAEAKLRKIAAIRTEESSKNWRKILGKFALWLVSLVFAFILLRAGRITPKIRLAFIASAVLLFGIIFGPDPSPMGTVKDAIVLFGRERIIFPPRMIALAVFLISVILANKFICAWGCQFGTLQELIFRINRKASDKSGIIRQIKIPFRITNGIRIAFFTVFTIIAAGWSFDIIKPIDPFTIFSPLSLKTVGIAFIFAILAASLFVYRPWCHMFCPFGLIGWIFEKISVNRIKVNYDTCVACESCAKACPSNVMNAILKQRETIPDCFSCGTCIGVCPTKSITFGKGKSSKPPEGKFPDKND
ncbi:MAG: 4Fe-4S binding protein [bacterium]